MTKHIFHAALAMILLHWLAAFASGQTFGLGDDESVVPMSTVSAETFGLGEPVAVRTPPVSRSAATVVRSSTYVSPPGYHRHVTQSGVVIEHHDSNFGDPVAHAGIEWPWPKYSGPLAPGDTIHGGATDGVLQSLPNGKMETGSIVASPVFISKCPGGVCPSPRVGLLRRGVFRR